MTPFEAVYGIPPSSLLTYILGTCRVQEVDEYLCDCDTILCELRLKLALAWNRMKCQADTNQ